MAITTLFKTIEQVKEYITIDISTNINTVLPYIKQAEKFVKDIIGTDLYNSLSYFVNEDGDDSDIEALLPYVQLPLINFAYMLGAPKLAVNIGMAGISTTSNNNLNPADDTRIKDLIRSFASSGYDGLEDLLEFLEENKGTYSAWVSSTAYSYNKQFFVNNAKEMNDSIHIGISRYDFLKLKPFIHQIEQSIIKKAIGTDTFDAVKEEYADDDLSDENEILLLDYIRPAVCYMALNKHKQDQNNELEGRRYLEEMVVFLNENASATQYINYYESDLYSDPDEEVEAINNEDSGFFVFGKP